MRTILIAAVLTVVPVLVTAQSSHDPAVAEFLAFEFMERACAPTFTLSHRTVDGPHFSRIK